MLITLREFRGSDLAALAGWARAIRSKLFMSHTRPETGADGRKVPFLTLSRRIGD